MDYLRTEEQQYKYSKKKIPELQQRHNEMIERHNRECDELRAKMNRHEAMVDEFEMRDYNG